MSPGKRPLWSRVSNRIFHVLARFAPGSTTLRPALHRWRGAEVRKGAFIGDGVYIDNEFPECVEIHENVQISVRAILIAHTRGPGRLIIERDAFIGPGSILICGAGKTLKIGAGSVVGAGSVITRSIPPGLYVAPDSPTVLAKVGVPLPLAKTMEEFWSGLSPAKKSS
ncbi:MAG: acyltransferase [Verrucomicrobia bacterium]|nr:acyltransferase [Verrucomicrobiota bacterium]